MKRSKESREKFYRLYGQNKTLQNMINWKKSRAEHKYKVRSCKQISWREFVGSLNKRTPINVIYEQIRKIRGRKQRKVNILHEQGRYFTTIPEMAHKLDETVSQASSSDNYSPLLWQLKRMNE